MKLSKRGEDISVSVENITPFGIWLFVKEKEYFLSYKDYPYFKDQTINSIQNVQLLHGYHLYWPELDVDLEIDNLENPEKYPLKDKAALSRGERVILETLYELGGRASHDDLFKAYVKINEKTASECRHSLAQCHNAGDI